MFGLPRGAKSFLQFWAAEVSEKRETQETSVVLTGIVECLIDSNCSSHNNQGDSFLEDISVINLQMASMPNLNLNHSIACDQ